MIPANQDFIEAVMQPSRTFKAKFFYAGQELDCDLLTLNIHKGACEEFALGAIFSSYIEASVSNLDIKIDGKELELKIGVRTESGAYSFITVGFYTVIKAKSNTHTTTFTAYGRIAKLGAIPFETAGGATLRDILSQIEELSGVSVEATGFDLDIAVNKAFIGMSCRDALAIVTFLLGGFATESYDGSIIIRRFQLPQQGYSVDGNRMLSEAVVDDENYELSGVKVIVSEEGVDEEGEIIEEESYEYGTVREIYNNQYMSQSLFTQFAANCVGYQFMPGEMDIALGDPRLEADDAIQVTDINGVSYNIPCHLIEHVYDGGLKSRISAQVTTDSDGSEGGEVTQELSRMRSNLVSMEYMSSLAQQKAADAERYAIEAKGSADDAKTSADTAREQADAAASSARGAYREATAAREAADGAQKSATEASGSARQANEYARGALSELSTVQDVIGTLGWISEHGEYVLTEDTQIDINKAYFEDDGDGGYRPVSAPVSTAIADMYELSDGEYIKTEDTQADPDKTYYAYDLIGDEYIEAVPTETIGNYFELSVDESVRQYIASHLALTDEGLYVVKDDSAYRVLVAPNRVEILNAEGTPVAVYGSEIQLGSAAEGIRAVINSTRLAFRTDSGDLAYFGLADDGTWQMHISIAHVDDMMRFGDYAWIKRENGNMSLKWLGDEE